MATRIHAGNAKPWLLSGLRLGMLLFLVAPSTLSAQSSFSGPRDYVVGSYPKSVAVGDFNGDGHPDVATANYYSKNISVLLQNNDGSFQAAVSYAVGNMPTSLRVGDVNGDGKLDLLLINKADNTIAVLLGNGDGTFATQKLTTISTGIAARYLAVGDFNRDGKLDVALPASLPQVGAFGAAVLLGNGDGTFQPAVTYAVNGSPLVLAAADFNNDGKLDLVSEGNGVSVLLGNGDGTFQAAINTAAANVAGFLVVADFNQDGNLDIATTTGNSPISLTLLLGNGNGTFQTQALPLAVAPIAVGDLNGDGKPDLVVTSGSSADFTIETLLNNGGGAFTVGQSLADATPGQAVTLADLDGDQKLDLVMPQWGTHVNNTALPDIVSILHGNGDGTFASFPSYPVNAGVGVNTQSILGTLAPADFNGDGKIDLGVGIELLSHGPPSGTGFGLLLNNGAGFSPATLNRLTSGIGAPVYASAGDFNGDGHMDLAVASSDIAIILGNGDGTFQSDVHYGTGMTGPIAVGDVNNDGKLDVIGASSSAPGVSVLLGTGDGTFGFPVNSSAGSYPPGNSVRALAVGDFNRDGKMDVAALVGDGQTAQLAVLLGNGDGNFSIGSTFSVGSNPTSVATGDLNGDGILDLIVGNADGVSSQTLGLPSAVVVLLGTGNGTFGAPTTTVVGNGISSVAVADFNLDGKADVAIVNLGWNDVSLLLGNGDGTLQAPMQFYLNNTLVGAAAAGTVTIADFDGNGSPDLAVAGATNIDVLLSEGSGPAALLLPATVGFGNESVGQTSAVHTTTLSNSGAATLNIGSITISGLQSGDYQQTHTCGASLTPGTSCTISTTFSPQAAGVHTAAIQITDNAFNSPQRISLSGTGTNTGLGLAAGPGAGTATATAGQTATYTLSIGGAGASGTATLTCSGAPQGATCSLPGTASVTAASNFTVSVTTTSRTIAATHFPGLIRWTWAAVLIGLLVFPVSSRTGGRQRRYSGAALICLLAVICSCGGTSSGPTSSGTKDNPNGTPAGTYTLTVSAVVNSATEKAILKLIVQ